MLTGQGLLSLRKQDLAVLGGPAVGFQTFKFAHKAVGGETGLNLNALITPPEMAANGFTNPSGATLASANLLFFRNNLELWSSLHGDLEDYLSYVVASSTQINFIGFVAAPGEIFIGTVDYSAVTNFSVANTVSQPVSGTLAANTTLFNIGQSFPVNRFSASSIGAVTVFKDGVLQNRNTGNSSVVLDGNYWEVDNGSGNFSTINFNVAETYNTTIDILPTGFIIEQNNGSLQSTIEAAQGQLNNMAQYVATATGNTVATILGGAPSNVDLTTFGNSVLTLQQTLLTLQNTFANRTTANTWIAYQNLPGRTDNTQVAAGNVGQVLAVGTTNFSQASPVVSTQYTVHSLVLPAGIWAVLTTATADPDFNSASQVQGNHHAITAGSATTLAGSANIYLGGTTVATLTLYPLTIYTIYVVPSTATLAFQIESSTFITGSPGVADQVGVFQASTVATRIG